MSIAAFAREVRDLTWYFSERMGDIARDVQSGQSRWEEEIKARAKMARHRAFWMRDGRIDETPRWTLVKGSDLHCGCTVHRTGQPGGCKGGEAINPFGQYAVREESPIASALTYADDSAPYLREPESPPWTCAAPPSKVLELRFYWPLTPDLAMFDPSAARVRQTLEMAESGKKLNRERARLAREAARSKEERGPGNLAPLTVAAREEFGDVRPERMAALVRSFGRKLARPVASPSDRYVQREIAAECEALLLFALGVYRRSHGRVPERVRRAGLR